MEDIFPRRIKAHDLRIAAPDAAVAAVLDAAVGEFQQAAVKVHIADVFQLDGVGCGIERLQVLGVRQAQEEDQVFLIQFVFV